MYEFAARLSRGAFASGAGIMTSRRLLAVLTHPINPVLVGPTTGVELVYSIRAINIDDVATLHYLFEGETNFLASGTVLEGTLSFDPINLIKEIRVMTTPLSVGSFDKVLLLTFSGATGATFVGDATFTTILKSQSVGSNLRCNPDSFVIVKNTIDNVLNVLANDTASAPISILEIDTVSGIRISNDRKTLLANAGASVRSPFTFKYKAIVPTTAETGDGIVTLEVEDVFAASNFSLNIPYNTTRNVDAITLAEVTPANRVIISALGIPSDPNAQVEITDAGKAIRVFVPKGIGPDVLFVNPFNKFSAHHLPIGTGATYGGPSHPANVSFAKRDTAVINVGIPFGTYVVKGNPADPVQTIKGTGFGLPTNIRLPNNFNPGAVPGTDSVISYLNPETGKIHDLWRFEVRADGFYAGINRTYDADALGHPSSAGQRLGVSASGAGMFFGILRGAEINNAGVAIKHALQMVVPNTGSGSMLSKDTQFPAASIDGFCVSDPGSFCLGDIPYGGLFAIPPISKGGPNLATLGLSEAGLRLATCLRDYGIYAVDTGGNVAIRADQFVTPAVRTQLLSDLSKIYGHLRFVTNSEWSSGLSCIGGGTPIADNSAYEDTADTSFTLAVTFKHSRTGATLVRTMTVNYSSGTGTGFGGRGPLSGLPWRSGATGTMNSKNLAAQRGKALDVTMTFGARGKQDATEREGWLDIRGGDTTGFALQGCLNGLRQAGNWILALPAQFIPIITYDQWPFIYAKGGSFRRDGAAREDMFAATASGSFSAGGLGTTDDIYDDFGAKLKRVVEHYGWKTVIIRMNHEANGTESYPHFVQTTSQATPFINATRRAIARIRAAAASTNFTLLFCQNFGRNSNGGSIGPDLWVGKTHCEIFELDFYDRNPPQPITDQASMNRYLNNTRGTSRIYKKRDGVTPLPGCNGPATWADFARQQGVHFAIGEWGVKGLSEDGAEGDNPVFIEGIWNFLNDINDVLAYECYFNQGNSDLPTFPNSFRKYKNLWGA